MTHEIDAWLASIGLLQHAAAFHANHIDAAMLPRLTAEDLKEIGVASLGHRKKMLESIAGIGRPVQPEDARQRSAQGDAAPVRAAAPLVAAAAGPVPAAPPGRHPNDYTPRHLADKILQSRSALEGERKQVSVLFADVQGSMELAEQLDPEEWHAILERFFAILTEGVHRFEGTVNQYTGDGIMTLFGAPIAHEDHSQRA